MTLLLPFILEDERYALRLTDIQEVIEDAEPHYLPAAPPEIIGAVNVHGRILPVLDLALCLGFSPAGWGTRMIVLSDPEFVIVLAVHRLERMISVDLEQIDQLSGENQKDCIGGLINWNDEMLSLLDLEQLQKRVKEKCIASGGDYATARTDR